MKLYGLTGGIASGKSTVSTMFETFGASIIDADKLSREVVEPGQPALELIAKRWPDCVIDGKLNRVRLGSQVFKSVTQLQELEAIIHPAIQEEMHKRVLALEAGGKKLAIYDAALIFEKGLEKDLEGVILVVASRETQIYRMHKRDGLTEAEARQRIEAQLPLSEKKNKAQFIIDTDVPIDQTRKQVSQVWEHLNGGREQTWKNTQSTKS